MAITQASRQIFYGGAPNVSPATSGNSYLNLHSIGSFESWNSNNLFRSVAFANSGVLRNIRFVLSVAPGPGASYEFFIYRNSVNVAFVVASGIDTEVTIPGPVTITAGDTVAVGCFASNTPATTTVLFSSEFESATDAMFELNGGTGDAPLDDGTEEFNSISPGGEWSATAWRGVVAPKAFTIRAFRVALSTAPGSGTRVYTIYKNGVAEASSQISITGAAVSGAATSLNISVAEGDYLTISHNRGDATDPTNSSMHAWGVQCESAVLGESVVTSSQSDDLDTDGVFQRIKNTSANVDSATESNVQRLAWGPVHELRKLYYRTSTQNDGGTRTITLRINSSSTGLSATIADAGTAGSDTETVTVNPDDLLSMLYNETGTPSVEGHSWSFVQYVQPIFYDSLTITDTVTATEVTRFVSVSDSVSIVDAVSGLNPQRFRSDVVSSVSLLETQNLSKVMNTGLLTDAISIAEDVQLQQAFIANVNDAISITESVTVRAAFQTEVYDQLYVTDDSDQVQQLPENNPLSVSESISISEFQRVREGDPGNVQLPGDRPRGDAKPLFYAGYSDGGSLIDTAGYI